MRWIARYLHGTRDKGTTFTPDPSKGLEVFVDADFAGNWDKSVAHTDRDTARSRHGYIVMYAGCPLLWKSQLQGEIALSSTENELSYALREVIPIMQILEEMAELDYPVHGSKPEIKCKVFEDNSGALEMAKNPKFRPRMKHINVKIHHFRDYVDRKQMLIHSLLLTCLVGVSILTPPCPGMPSS